MPLTDLLAEADAALGVAPVSPDIQPPERAGGLASLLAEADRRIAAPDAVVEAMNRALLRKQGALPPVGEAHPDESHLYDNPQIHALVTSGLVNPGMSPEAIRAKVMIGMGGKDPRASSGLIMSALSNLGSGTMRLIGQPEQARAIEESMGDAYAAPNLLERGVGGAAGSVPLMLSTAMALRKGVNPAIIASGAGPRTADALQRTALATLMSGGSLAQDIQDNPAGFANSPGHTLARAAMEGLPEALMPGGKEAVMAGRSLLPGAVGLAKGVGSDIGQEAFTAAAQGYITRSQLASETGDPLTHDKGLAGGLAEAAGESILPSVILSGGAQGVGAIGERLGEQQAQQQAMAQLAQQFAQQQTSTAPGPALNPDLIIPPMGPPQATAPAQAAPMVNPDLVVPGAEDQAVPTAGDLQGLLDQALQEIAQEQAQPTAPESSPIGKPEAQAIPGEQTILQQAQEPQKTTVPPQVEQAEQAVNTERSTGTEAGTPPATTENETVLQAATRLVSEGHPREKIATILRTRFKIGYSAATNAVEKAISTNPPPAEVSNAQVPGEQQVQGNVGVGAPPVQEAQVEARGPGAVSGGGNIEAPAPAGSNAAPEAVTTPAAPATHTPQPGAMVNFPKESGTLGIPRAEMPQVRGSDRPEMLEFLRANGTQSERVTVTANDIKPTQAEYDPGKIGAAGDYGKTGREIIVSSDNHIVDGHHQWMAAMKDNPQAQIPVIRINAPIRGALQAVSQFPKARAAGGGQLAGAAAPESPTVKESLPVGAATPTTKAATEPDAVAQARKIVTDYEANRENGTPSTPPKQPTQAAPLSVPASEPMKNNRAGQADAGATPAGGTTQPEVTPYQELAHHPFRLPEDADVVTKKALGSVIRALGGSKIKAKIKRVGPGTLAITDKKDNVIVTVKIASHEDIARIQAAAERQGGEPGQAPNGWYENGTIYLSPGAAGGFTFNHEIIHAFKELGLITPAEYSALIRIAKRNAGIVESVERRYSKADQKTKDDEYVAHFFEGLANGSIKLPNARVWQRIKDFLRDIGHLLTGGAIQQSERGLVRDVAAGKPLGRKATLNTQVLARYSLSGKELPTSWAGLTNEQHFQAAAEQFKPENDEKNWEAYKNLKDTLGGKIIDIDQVRELYAPYAASDEARNHLAPVIHDALKGFTSRMIVRKLEGNPTGPVLMLAGGGGSGKSTLRDKTIPHMRDQAEFIIDAVQGNTDKARAMIEIIKSSGRRVQFVYVHTEPAVAAKRAYGRARRVDPKVLAAAHAGANDTILKLAPEYQSDPAVSISIYDSTQEDVKPQLTLAELERKRYTPIDGDLQPAIQRLEGVFREAESRADAAKERERQQQPPAVGPEQRVRHGRDQQTAEGILPEARGTISEANGGIDRNDKASLSDKAPRFSLGPLDLSNEQPLAEDPNAKELSDSSNKLAAEWQAKLPPSVKVVMGGSLVSRSYVQIGNESVDMDVRFLTENPERDYPLVEQATGLKMRKTIQAANYAPGQPSSNSTAYMVEGQIEYNGVSFDVEASVRNPSYVGWGKFYPQVLTADEMDRFRGGKKRLKEAYQESGDKADKDAYKAFKGAVLQEVMQRAEKQGLVKEPKFSQQETKTKNKNLANPGITADTRKLVDEVDQVRELTGEPGTRSDKTVGDEAQARFKKNPDAERRKLLGTIRTGGQLNDVETIIAHHLINRDGLKALAGTDPDELAAVQALIWAYRQAGSEQARAFRQRRDRMATPEERLTNLVQAILSPPATITEKVRELFEAGEAQQANKIMHTWAINQRKIIDGMKAQGVDLEDLALPEKLTDPVAMARMLNRISMLRAQWGDKVMEYWIHAILSGPATQVVNLTSNIAATAWEHGLQRPVNALISQIPGFRGKKDAQTIGELRHVYTAMLKSMPRAMINAYKSFQAETDILEFSRNVSAMDHGGKLESYRGPAIGGWHGRIIRTPGRSLVAADSLLKTVLAHAEVTALAYRRGKADGLTGAALQKHISDELGDPQSAVWEDALVTAKELTFQKDLDNKVGSGLSKMRSAELPGGIKPLAFVLPFVRTPWNIFAIGLRKSPLGSIRLATKVLRKGIRAASKNDDGTWDYSAKQMASDLSEQLVAWSAVAALFAAAQPGDDDDEDPRPFITGSGTGFRGERGKREYEMRSEPPTSIRIGDEWYNYGRIEPFATALSAMVDLARIVGTDESIASKAGEAFSKISGQVRNKTFLAGVSDILNVMTDPDQNAERYVTSFAASWVPNAIRQPLRSAQENIPEMKHIPQANSDTEAMVSMRRFRQTAFPLESQGPAPKVDVWGREIPRYPGAQTDWLGRIMRGMSPVQAKLDTATKADLWLRKWNEAHPEDEYWPVLPQAFRTVDGEKIKYTESEYHDLMQESGKMALEAINEYKVLDEAPTEENIKYMKKILDRSRLMARKNLADRNADEKVTAK